MGAAIDADKVFTTWRRTLQTREQFCYPALWFCLGRALDL